MDDLQKEFLDIVTQVRTHLELNLALGVTAIEIPLPGRPSSVPDVPPVKAAPEIKEPVKIAAVPAQQPGLAGIREELQSCNRCKLGKDRNKVVFGEGNPRAALVFIGAAPGREEDEQGKSFVDAAGNLLTDIIVKGMKLRREDVYLCTFLKCRLPENRTPDAEELEACEQFLVRQLETIKPKIIVALGGVAANALLKTNEDIGALRGKWHEYRGIRLMPTLGPDHLLQNPADKKTVWDDIKMVMAEMEKIKKG